MKAKLIFLSLSAITLFLSGSIFGYYRASHDSVLMEQIFVGALTTSTANKIRKNCQNVNEVVSYPDMQIDHASMMIEEYEKSRSFLSYLYWRDSDSLIKKSSKAIDKYYLDNPSALREKDLVKLFNGL